MLRGPLACLSRGRSYAQNGAFWAKLSVSPPRRAPLVNRSNAIECLGHSLGKHARIGVTPAGAKANSHCLCVAVRLWLTANADCWQVSAIRFTALPEAGIPRSCSCSGINGMGLAYLLSQDGMLAAGACASDSPVGSPLIAKAPQFAPREGDDLAVHEWGSATSIRSIRNRRSANMQANRSKARAISSCARANFTQNRM
jgi:hypothetical protein